MSYEPNLLIRQMDLELKRSILESESWDVKHVDNIVSSYLLSILDEKPIILGDLHLLYLKPETTNFNLDVRNKLCELGVEYGIDN